MAKSGVITDIYKVDFIHRNPILASAVANAWKDHIGVTTLGMIYTSWASFSHDHLVAAPWIVLDAFFDDHVPLPLKARAISTTGRQCIVLGEVRPAQRSALAAEGTFGILDEDLTAEEIPEQIEAVTRGAISPLESRSSIGIELTDREIQILELYARRRALTVSSLAAALGLRTATVKGHLFRGRKKLSAAGFTCATRTELAQVLQEIGYSHTDAQWHAVGRW